MRVTSQEGGAKRGGGGGKYLARLPLNTPLLTQKTAARWCLTPF